MTPQPIDPIEAIARTTLYEGYLLWPYRRSAIKNRQRWTFGGVYPRGFCETAREGDTWRIRSELLLGGDDATRVDLELRCLHLVHRQALVAEAGGMRPVDRLDAGGREVLTWDEATERRFTLAGLRLGDAGSVSREERLIVAAGEQLDELRDREDRLTGAVRRSWQPLEARWRAVVERLDRRLFRLSISVTNAADWRGDDRAEAQRRSLLSTHLVARVSDGAFHSLTDPPAPLAEAARRCRNEGVWPVLVGERGRHDAVLAAPIVLEDWPRIAPESPGDLFDGGEIDQLLVLNVRSLSDPEKSEMAATDPRGREILERCEALTPAQIRRLHGAIRDPAGDPT